MSQAQRKAGGVGDEESLEHTRMTLGEHLEELRTRVLRSVVALVVAFFGAFAYHEQITDWLLRPYYFTREHLEQDLYQLYTKRLAEDPSLQWQDYFETATPAGPQDLRDSRRVPETPRGDGAGTGFLFYMRYSFYFALFVAGPFVIWQAWLFIAAGLYKHERRIVHSFLPLSLALFMVGVLFGYFFLVPYGLYYLAQTSIEQIQYWESLDSYSTFLTSLTLAAGVIFQTPVVMVVLAKVGLVEPRLYSRFRPHMVVAVLAIAAVLTPPDVISQVLMAGPMLLLYEIGALAARVVAPKRAAEPEPAP